MALRDSTKRLLCWAYRSYSEGQGVGGGHGDSNNYVGTNTWRYVACVHSGINLWTVKDQHVQHVSSNLGFTLNYHDRNIQFAIGPTRNGNWNYVDTSFAAREIRYWQVGLHSDLLIENQFKKLEGIKWGNLGLYYQMGQRENGLIIDSSVNQLHIGNGWLVTTDAFSLSTIYNIARNRHCPHGQTRDFQNSNECFTGIALPRFTPTKP